MPGDHPRQPDDGAQGRVPEQDAETHQPADVGHEIGKAEKAREPDQEAERLADGDAGDEGRAVEHGAGLLRDDEGPA